jgi:hypothetical protein
MKSFWREAMHPSPRGTFDWRLDLRDFEKFSEGYTPDPLKRGERQGGEGKRVGGREGRREGRGMGKEGEGGGKEETEV